jgi:hypothetical protein
MIMKKTFSIFIAIGFSFICFSQNSSHIISGIDLNKDWITLTNQSGTSYYIQEDYRNKQGIDGVAMEIHTDYLLNYVDKDFLNIGFTELVLIFPKGGQATGLEKLEPRILIATLEYESYDDYGSFNEKAFSEIASILMRQFGPPDNTMKESWGASFEWFFDNAQLMFTSTKTEQLLRLMYVKQG